MSALNEQFQLSYETREDRFPKIFRTIQRNKPEAKKILSFGCSTGEECFTLQKYFPEAEITGYDINKWSLDTGKRRAKDQKLKNIHFISKLDGEYDVVVALMVFFSIAQPLKSGAFNKAVHELSERVKPSGLIAFHNLEYPFEDEMEGFKPVRTWKHHNNRNPDKIYYGGVFRKQKASIFHVIFGQS